uniref:Glucuronosyltransferase n=1 Tax=Panagrolaimus sp. ES5 TaxID=591445 RepID=A0AC34FZD5_9BILA
MDNFLPFLINFHVSDVSIKGFYENAFLNFGEHIDRLDNIQTVASDLAIVGSNCKSASKSIDSTLSNEWKIFVEDPKSKGTIYIAFGTAIRWDVAADLAIVGSNCKSASKSIDSTLTNEWKKFVEDSKSKGTIYIAFGTAIRWDGAPQNVKNAFIDAINELDEYRIIFSWNGIFPKNVKSHVKFTKWAQQMPILLHPKTVLFVTHGGLKRF